MRNILLAIFLVFMPFVARAGGENVSQDSLFWPTSGVGDGNASGYTSDQWAWYNRMAWTNDPTTQGVALGFLNNLVVTTPGPQALQMATGGAIVYGFPFQSTQVVDFALPLPIAGTTFWRIVLRADWATQTVRAVLLMGDDGVAVVPAVTQIAGVRWEIPLYAGSIVVATGAVTVQAGPSYLDPGIRIDDTKITDRDREFLVQPVECVVAAASAVRTSRYGWPLADAVDTECFGAFKVPADFDGIFMSVTPVFVPNAAGGGNSVLITNNAEFGAVGEAPDTHTDTSGAVLSPIGAVVIMHLADIALNPDVAVEDYVTLRLFRDGDGAGDNYANTLFFMGWWVEYTADS